MLKSFIVSGEGVQPLVEAKFNSASGALAFRREGVKLAKADHAEFASLFFSNSVNQSTRVRIEILKALAKRLQTTTEDAFVQGYVSRPVLQYRVTEGARSVAEGVGRSYTFVDAIAKFGTSLRQADLAKAYLKAGTTFNGALSQYFIVLSDFLPRPLSSTTAYGQAPRRGSRGGHGRAGPTPGGSGFRGSRGARGAYVSRLFDSSQPPPATPDRGVKRSGTDFPSVPSKKKENNEDNIATMNDDNLMDQA